MIGLVVVVPDGALRAALSAMLASLARRQGWAHGITVTDRRTGHEARACVLVAGPTLDEALACLVGTMPRSIVLAVVPRAVAVKWAPSHHLFQVVSGPGPALLPALGAVLALHRLLDDAEFCRDISALDYDGSTVARLLDVAVAESRTPAGARRAHLERLAHLLGVPPAAPTATAIPGDASQLGQQLRDIRVEVSEEGVLPASLARWPEPPSAKIDSLGLTAPVQVAALEAEVARAGTSLPRQLAARASGEGARVAQAFFTSLRNQVENGTLPVPAGRAQLVELATDRRPGDYTPPGEKPLARARALAGSWTDQEASWVKGAILAPGGAAGGLQSLAAGLSLAALVATLPLTGWALLALGLPLTPPRLAIAAVAGAAAGLAVQAVHRLVRRQHLDAAESIQAGMDADLGGLRESVERGRAAATARLVATAGADAQGRAAAMLEMIDTARRGFRELVAIPAKVEADGDLADLDAIASQRSAAWAVVGEVPGREVTAESALLAAIDARIFLAALAEPFDARMLLLDRQRGWIDEALARLPAPPPAVAEPPPALRAVEPLGGTPPGVVLRARVRWEANP